MADDNLIVVEDCRISPPPATVGERRLPLTFFDMFWLTWPPPHQLFLYQYPHSKTHFIQTTLPNLKHSLSLTLQHFFPFTSNLTLSNPQTKPEIRHLEGDSVAFTVAECGLDFNELVGNHPRACHKFYPLIPRLGHASNSSNHVTIPLFSVQVTLFPNTGISIGLTNHHTLCDATTKFHFLKAWTTIAKHGTDELFLASDSFPIYDRAIKYPVSLDKIYINQPGIESLYANYQPPHLGTHTNKDWVRATFVLTRQHINRMKTWLSVKLPRLEYVSSFSIACGYVWSCRAKSGVQIGEKRAENGLERFICAVDWRGRMDPPLPQTYHGNCVGPCITTSAKTTLLASNKGFLTAVELVGKAISETLKNDKDGMMKDAETWIERTAEPVPGIGVAGSPKIKLYDLDFGWGKPKKYETISIDYNGSISVNSCRDSDEDMEIGVSLPDKLMDAFIAIFRDELESLFPEQE